MARRCPYLEQIMVNRLGPLTRYRSDCHVTHKTETFNYLRHPAPPCLTAYEACRLFQRQHDEENRSITRYTD
ncbi:MAG TPA: hypothetical protein VIN56_11185 [Candidatus Dormibacteraeota bacterium]|jgi:hypothetical protein